MKLRNLVFKEMGQRWNQLFFSLLAIVLGIAAIVAIKNISSFSEKAVARELDTLGANILILPKSSSIQDYYSADFQEEVIPEEYVDILINSEIEGIDNLSPKLNLPVTINDQEIMLTGILPKNEYKSKASWQGALGIFERPEGCGEVPEIPGNSDAKKNIVRKRVIEDLGENALLAGSEVASALKLKEGDILQIMGKDFTVEVILPATGTVDDNRLFTNLRTVQDFTNKSNSLNVIEIVGCCSAISKGLIQQINTLLPDARVVTISQIVQTQINTNKIMNKLSLVMLIIIIIMGGAGIANYMFANVYERRREIGIMMAMGAGPEWIAKLFLLKSLIIGIAGGIAGYITGTLIAVILGPRLAEIPVFPMPVLALYGLVISIIISLGATILPAIKATKLDPYIIMQEE